MFEKSLIDCTQYIWTPKPSETSEDGEVLGTCELKSGAPRCARDPEYALDDKEAFDQCFVRKFW